MPNDDTLKEMVDKKLKEHGIEEKDFVEKDKIREVSKWRKSNWKTVAGLLIFISFFGILSYLSDIVSFLLNILYKIHIDKFLLSIGNNISDIFEFLISFLNLSYKSFIVEIFFEGIEFLEILAFILFKYIKPSIKFLFGDLGPNTFFGTIDKWINIHTGIGAILVGFIFFVARQLLKENSLNGGKTFLYISFISPLLVAEICIFFLLIFGYENRVTILPVILLGVFIIYFFGEVIQSLSDDSKKRKKRKYVFKNQLKDKISQLYYYSLQLKYKDKELKENSFIIQSNRLLDLNKSKENNSYKKIDLEDGHIRDINFSKLREIINKFRNIPTKTYKDENKYNDINKNCEEEERKIKFYYRSLNDYGIYIDKSFLENNELEEDIKEIFKINKDNKKRSIKNEIREDLRRLRKKIVCFIENGEKNKIERYSNLYLELLNNEKVNKWLSDDILIIKDIKKILELGIESNNNRDIVTTVMYLPIRIANQAIQHSNHMIFQQIIDFPELIYYYSKKKNEGQIKDIMKDRSWRYLKEMVEYHLKPQLDRGKIDENDFEGFIKYIIKTFQNLIKKSFDDENKEMFDKYLDGLNELYKSNYQSYPKEKEVLRFKQEVLFGLGGWMLYKYDGKSDIKKYFEKLSNALNENLKNFMQKVNDRNKLKVLTKILLRTQENEIVDQWGRSLWEGKDKKGDGTYTINILGKIMKFYTIEALKRVNNFGEMDFDYNYKLSYLLEEGGSIHSILDDIEEAYDKGGIGKEYDLLSDNNIEEKISKFKDFLKIIEKQQNEKKLEKERQAKVDDSKRNEFKKAFIREFDNSNNSLMNFLDKHDLYKKEEEGKKMDRFGINVIYNKKWFISDDCLPHIHSDVKDVASNFSSDIIKGENKEIIQAIKDEVENEVNLEDFDSKIKKVGKPEDIVILSINMSSWQLLLRGKQILNNYTAKGNMKKKKKYNDVMGVYEIKDNKIPIYSVYDNQGKSKIVVFNKRNFGKIRQYKPLLDDESDKDKKGKFYMKIIDLKNNEEYKNNMIDKKPSFLSEYDSQKEKESYLDTQVVIKILEKFEVDIDSSIEGFYCTIDI